MQLPDSDPAKSSVPGQRTLGRYRNLVEVGRGGMSVVYRAHDPALRRDVALKLLAPALSGDAQALERFRREATSVASLKHPSIALVYEFGEHEGQPFIAFEWIDGENLRALLDREGRLGIPRTLRIFDQVAAALAYAHERGVIHRDVKPANLIVNTIAPGTTGASAADAATLVDFGLAWMADLPRVTSTGTFFGTPLYMAPEQIQGLALDQRTDLYSLAFVLYEMLAGRPPFDASNTPALLNRHLNVTPDALSEVNPALPAAIDAVFARATAKSPSARYPDVPSFQKAVHAALEGAQPGAPASSRPRWLSLAALGGGALAVAATTFVLTRQAAPANRVIDPSATQTPAATAMAPTTIAPTAERIQATATIAAAPTAALDADAAWLHDGYNSARNRYTGKLTPSQVNAPRWHTELEGELGETRALVMARGLLIATYENSRVVALKADTGAVIWSKQLTETMGAWPTLCCQWDNAALMVPMEDGQLVGLNLQDGAELWRMDAEALKGGVRRGMTLGDDGLVYAITGAAHVIAFDGREGKLLWSLKLEGEELTTQPALTNAGIYVISRNNAVIAVDRVKHEVVWRAEIPGPSELPPAVSGDGSAVVVALEDRRVLALSSLSGKLLWETTVNEGVAGIALDWGRVIATCYDGSLYSWQLNTGKVLWQVNMRGGIALPPLTDAEQVLVMNREGESRAFEADTGLELANYNYRIDGVGTESNPPAYAPGWVFVQVGNSIRAYAP